MSFKKLQQGFSLLELMVVIAIFLIITGVVMIDIPNFGRKGALDLTVQGVAGCVRYAQTYGNSRKIDTSDNSPVGAFLEPGIVTVFFDMDSSHSFGASDQVLETCVLDGYSLSYTNDIANIIFPGTNYTRTIKSNLEPEFYNSGGVAVPSSPVEITITSIRNGEKRCVFVYASGQITVGDCNQ